MGEERGIKMLWTGDVPSAGPPAQHGRRSPRFG